ncbi:DUF4214 domain-containing protein [Massilia sp. CFBP9026]|nr:DUF4214 domain-containing protein [Massilia sp. CFBP9026]MDY0962221.1 DUF4214 domain-containing protein [Massilia sp. CFBP9026]
MSTFSTYDSTVNSFYLAFYGRPADPAGLKFWSQQLAANNGELGAITQAFATSEEAQVRFGTDTVGERVAEIYQHLFNRAPDATGLAYWTDVVAKGNASLADVAVAILGGAQGSDARLSELRQQAADAFTAAVESGGTEYSGYASIEAARILVRAVTPGATQADLDLLVKAAVSFADTATKTPQVVEAIAVNTTLLALFDTARGKGEPVNLAQALADTAKAAAGDPVTLESLLRGGGMDKVLKVMPANATLKDVVEALAKGGLPAAVDVVYPPSKPVPATPVSELKIDFHSLEQPEGDTQVDFTTRKQKPVVEFEYSGRELAAGERFEFSLDNENWSSNGVVPSSSSKTVALHAIDLSLGSPLDPIMMPDFTTLDLDDDDDSGIDPNADLATTVYVRVVDTTGATVKLVASDSQQIVWDHYAAAPQARVLPNDNTMHFGNAAHNVTNKAELYLENVEPGAKVEYSLDPTNYGRGPLLPERVWSDKMPELKDDGYYTVRMRQTDVSGNQSQESSITFTLDRTAPKEPTIALSKDSGVPEDGITNVNKIAISDLDTSGLNAWEYRINGGEWIFGALNGNNDTAVLTLDDVEDGPVSVQVRQIDAAGNSSDPSDALEFELDTTAPEGKFLFDSLEGASVEEEWLTTLEKADVRFEFDGALNASDTFQFSLDDGEWEDLDANAFDVTTSILTVSNVDFSTKDRTVAVRVVDQAGNATSSKSTSVESSFNDVPLAEIASVTPQFGPTGPKLLLDAGLDTLASVNPADLTFKSFNTGAGVTTPDFFDGANFKLASNVLTLDAMPALGLYQLGWEKGAFVTGAGVDVEAGSELFVGGSIATVALPGFAIDSMEWLSSTGVNASNDDKVNIAYIGQQGINAVIHAGGGNDLIADNGSALTIQFDKLSQGAYDVVLGFDTGTGPDGDKIEITNDTAILFDKDRNGNLTWNTAAGDKYVPPVGTEAVQINLPGAAAFAALAGGNTLGALNAALNVSNIAQGKGLLILATYEDQSILLSYIEKTTNQKIDQGDIAFLGVFDQGIVNTGDIHLVGSYLPPEA